MRALVQRVKEASVEVQGSIVSKMGPGLLIFLGIEENDAGDDTEWLVNKINGMRIFSDANDKMNLSISDVNGSFLVVSQFTLHASTKKGNRPSFIKAAKPDKAVPEYESFCKRLQELSGLEVHQGMFGAYMMVKLINDGPVTIWIDSKSKE